MHTEKIILIHRIEAPVKVYNLAVETDESYTANGIIVHNCRSRIIGYFGTIPGERDFTERTDGKTITESQVDKNINRIDLFREKYWKVPETI